MADHNKPAVTTGYLDFVSQMHDKMNDISRGLDPAHTSPTNMPQYAVRWSSASKKWQIWSGTAWNDLADEYAINVSGYAAKLKTARKISIGGGATADGVDFDGTSNIALNLTAIDYTKVSGLGSASTKTIGSNNGDVLEVGTGSGNSRTNSQNDSRFARLSGGDDANFTTAPKINGVSVGTAATKNVGTSSGNVMEVGAFGVGKAVSIGAGANLNDYRSSGFYLQSNHSAAAGGSNFPDNKAGSLIVVASTLNASVTCTQMYVVHEGNRLWIRGLNWEGNWSSWLELTGGGETVTWGNISGKPATATRWPSWGEVTGKPGIPPYNQSLGAGAVGSYAFLVGTNGAPGVTVSGSNLKYSDAGSLAGSVPSGTWRRMGQSGLNKATLWLRIS